MTSPLCKQAALHISYPVFWWGSYTVPFNTVTRAGFVLRGSYLLVPLWGIFILYNEPIVLVEVCCSNNLTMINSPNDHSGSADAITTLHCAKANSNLVTWVHVNALYLQLDKSYWSHGCQVLCLELFETVLSPLHTHPPWHFITGCGPWPKSDLLTVNGLLICTAPSNSFLFSRVFLWTPLCVLSVNKAYPVHG